MGRKIMPRLSYLLPALPVVLVHKSCLQRCRLECLPKGQLEPIPIPLNMFDVYVGPIKYRTLNWANFLLMLRLILLIISCWSSKCVVSLPNLLSLDSNTVGYWISLCFHGIRRDSVTDIYLLYLNSLGPYRNILSTCYRTILPDQAFIPLEATTLASTSVTGCSKRSRERRHCPPRGSQKSNHSLPVKPRTLSITWAPGCAR